MKNETQIERTQGMPSDYLLRLLYLADAADTPANNEKARALYLEQIRKLESVDEHRKGVV